MAEVPPQGGMPPWQAPDGNEVPAEHLPRFVHYLRAQPYARLVLEVDSVAGMEPYPQVEQRLSERFAQLLDKPGGVDVVRDETLAARGSDHAWTDEALGELAALHFNGKFDETSPAGSITIHVMMLDGHSARDGSSSRILGLAWGHLHIVIFKETIERTCRQQGLLGLLTDGACHEAELGIWTHEVGHVLGLVDNGLPMVEPHRDPDHGRHDEDPNCIMYWAYNGSSLVGRITDRLQANQDPTLSFCARCREDMNAAR